MKLTAASRGLAFDIRNIGVYILSRDECPVRVVLSAAIGKGVVDIDGGTEEMIQLAKKILMACGASETIVDEILVAQQLIGAKS